MVLTGTYFRLTQVLNATTSGVFSQYGINNLFFHH